MARVDFIASDSLPAQTARIYEQYATSYGPFRNQVAVLAHVPPAVEHLMGLLLELKQQRNLSWRHVELAVVVTSKLNQCHYCVAHHTEPLKVEGLSPAAIDMLPGLHEELDEVDRLVVDYAVAVSRWSRRCAGISRRRRSSSLRCALRCADFSTALMTPCRSITSSRTRRRRRNEKR